jgi:hypothetical protein
MAFSDVDLMVIAVEANISRPKARIVLEAAREIELYRRRATVAEQQRTLSHQCRIVGSCAVYDFPKSHIVRTPPEAA